ncbi:MAG: translation initiation factor [Clostridium sp.]|nr:translation initiation factor [Clostridium sp.]
MANNDWKQRLGMVYSTNPDFSFDTEGDEQEPVTLPPAQQRLRTAIEKKNRGGKSVTIVRGFTGTADDLKALGKQLKTRLGVGGAVKDGEIIIQGEWRDKVIALLREQGYTQTK